MGLSGRERRVLLCGGGTVGHLAPGFALAEVLRDEGVDARFATPGESHEREWFPSSTPAPLTIPAPRLPRGALDLAPFPFRLGRATWRAHAVLRRERPGAVIGLGGWPCVPAVLAAAVSHIPVVLIASDARPGVAVRRLAPLAHRLYAAQEGAARILGPSERVVVTGPLLRRGALAERCDPTVFGLTADRRTLLVTGGSLGAQALNRAVAEGVRAAVAAEPALRERLQVIHSVGRSGEGVAEAYREAGIVHHVSPFIRSMGDAYAAADLVVCRAGALTVAEVRAAGLPAVFVPYPHHADRQQYENARPLVEGGGARLLEEADLSSATIRGVVLDLLLDDEARASATRALDGPFADGAAQTARDLIRFLGWGPTSSPAPGDVR